MSDSIPLSVPHLGGNEWKYVKECLDTEAVAAAGTFIERFEKAVASWVGAPHSMATVNGTAALHLALRAVGVEPGDEVVAPDFTFVAPVNAAIYCGAVPVLLDVERGNGTLSPSCVAEFLRGGCERRDGAVVNRRTGRRVRAILPVHLYGHPADLDPIAALAEEFGIPIVEDAAESLGAEYKGTRVGGKGHTACFSFNGNKVITAGTGGMVVSGRPEVIRRCRHLATQARSHPTDYVHDEVGHNYRLPNLNAALGLAQFECLERFLDRKREIAAYYSRELASVPGLTLMGETPGVRSSWWLNTVILEAAEFGRSAEEVAPALRREGVESRRVWAPLHEQAPYRHAPFFGAKNSRWLFDRGLNLPSSVGIDEKSLARVVAAVKAQARS